MCNRYRPVSVTVVRDVFGFTLLEQPQPLYATQGIGPLQQGPFIRAGAAVVGQWGLIPWFSASRRPTGRGGRPISTNNCRIETAATAPAFREPWSRGQRCLIPAVDYDEPFWGTGRNTWWRLARADGAPWALAGLWNEWTDPATGAAVASYTMLTQNCDAHPLLNRFHKPDPALPADRQDKLGRPAGASPRAPVPIEPAHWEQWLHGSAEQALSLVRLPPVDLFVHGPAEPPQQSDLDLA